jgi:hypothetical protein
MPAPTQNYQNHARFFPLFHYIVAPILLINFFAAAWQLYRAPGLPTLWALIVAFALVALALAARLMALTVQDRVIRLEMQLRMARVLPPDLMPRVNALGRQHFVALRFAGDDELPGLVREICEGRLQTQKEIKMRVKNWQPDWLRA